MKKITFLVLTLALASSCSGTIKDDATKVESGVFDCTKQDLTHVVSPDGLTIAEDVATALAGKDANAWRITLTDLEVKFGAPLLACAVDTVRSVFAAAASATVTDKPSTAQVTPSPVLERADQVIKAKGWKFAKGGNK